MNFARRKLAAITLAGAIAGIPFMPKQCAPPPPPPPPPTGVGSCYTESNATTGYAACSAADANGFTEFRSVGYYTVFVPTSPQGPAYSFSKVTYGTWMNPRDCCPEIPEASREFSYVEVPSMLYLPAGSFPRLDRVTYKFR